MENIQNAAQLRTVVYSKRESNLRGLRTSDFPRWIWVVGGILAFWGWFSANPLLTPAAILVVVAAVKLVWRAGEPAVLSFAVVMQWLQAAAIIFYTNFYGISVGDAAGGPEFETATWLSLLAVLILAIGMRLALVRCAESQHCTLVAEALKISIPRAFIAYIACAVVASISQGLTNTFSSIAQLLYALVYLKWAALFVLAYAVLEQRRGYAFVLVAILLEVLLGLVSYFSNFKSVFFILVVLISASPLALRGRRLVATAAVGTLLFLMGVAWTAIKADYREFVNQGSGEQAVVVSTEESISEFGHLIQNVSWNSLANGLDSLVLRLGYTNYFALTLMNVPSNVPYENGALWLGAIKHVFVPRLLFPDKAPIDDSERTTLYTGRQVAGVEQGTSIGIGYVAESYVDFGSVGMFVPIFLLGLFFGLVYRALVLHSRAKLICTGIATSILIFNAYAIETSNVKIFGGTVTACLVAGSIYLVFGKALRDSLERSE
jgi:hypothetical protein